MLRTHGGRHGGQVAAADDDAGLRWAGADVQQEGAHVGHDQVVVLRIKKPAVSYHGVHCCNFVASPDTTSEVVQCWQSSRATRKQVIAVAQQAHMLLTFVSVQRMGGL